MAKDSKKLPRSMPFQARFLEDESPEILVEKSRQIGFSEYTALKFVRYSIRQDAKYDTYILSCDEDNAKQTLEDCRKWAKVYATGAFSLGQELIDSETVFHISFSTGRTIHVLSSNPNRLAGKRGNVVLDEFALHKDQQKLLKVSSACTQWGGQRIIISTHRGCRSTFYALTQSIEQGNPMRFSHYKVTLSDAIDQGLLDRINAKTGKNWTKEAFIADKRSKCLTEADYLEEYQCIAQDSAGQLIPWDSIAAAVSSSACDDADLASIADPLGMGVDVARKNDKHCYVAVRRLGGSLGDRFAIALVHYHADHSWLSRDRQLDAYAATPSLRRIFVDATGIGDKYVSDAQHRPNGHKIHAVTFTSATKEHLATQLARFIEERRLLIPDHALLKNHLAAIRRAYTPTGQLSYGSDHNADGHADLFWAAALALDALVSPPAAGAWSASHLDNLILRAHSPHKFVHHRAKLTK